MKIKYILTRKPFDFLRLYNSESSIYGISKELGGGINSQHLYNVTRLFKDEKILDKHRALTPKGAKIRNHIIEIENILKNKVGVV